LKTSRFLVLVLMLSAAVSMSAQLAFYAIPPCRIADTRNPSGPLGGPSLAAAQQRAFPILQSACGIPSTATAYSLNLTVIPQGYLGYLSIWPTGLNQPLVSTLNSFEGYVLANAAIVPAGSNGDVSVFVTDNTDLVIDVNGYFAQSSGGSQGNVNHARQVVTIQQNQDYFFTINWASAFPDTNYTATCTSQPSAVFQQPGTQVYLLQISSTSPTSLVVEMGANGGSGDVTVHCIGIHD